jgi:hypothetical protein
MGRFPVSQSSPQVRRDIGELWSQSIPTSTTLDMVQTMRTVEEIVTAKLNSRDLEPELESDSITICAPSGTGSLHHNTATDAYNFTVEVSTRHAISPTQPLQEIQPNAFPDEQPIAHNLTLHSPLRHPHRHSTHPTTHVLGPYHPSRPGHRMRPRLRQRARDVHSQHNILWYRPPHTLRRIPESQ